MTSIKEKRSSEDEKPPTPEEGQVLTPEAARADAERRTSVIAKDGSVVNASGYKDELQRQYGLLAICGLALTIVSPLVNTAQSLRC